MKKVKYLTIGGKKYPVKFGVNQTIEYCTLRNISITEYNKELKNIRNDVSIIRDFMWSALRDGARKEKIEFNMEPEDVADLLEDLEASELKGFFDSFTAENMPKIIGNEVDTSKKK